MSRLQKAHKVISWTLWLIVGIALADGTALLAGARDGALSGIVRDGAVIMLCAIGYGQNQMLFARRSALAEFAAQLDKRAAALDSRAQEADILVRHLDEWQAELMRMSGGQP